MTGFVMRQAAVGAPPGPPGPPEPPKPPGGPRGPNGTYPPYEDEDEDEESDEEPTRPSRNSRKRGRTSVESPSKRLRPARRVRGIERPSTPQLRERLTNYMNNIRIALNTIAQMDSIPSSTSSQGIDAAQRSRGRLMTPRATFIANARTLRVAAEFDLIELLDRNVGPRNWDNEALLQAIESYIDPDILWFFQVPLADMVNLFNERRRNASNGIATQYNRESPIPSLTGTAMGLGFVNSGNNMRGSNQSSRIRDSSSFEALANYTFDGRRHGIPGINSPSPERFAAFSDDDSTLLDGDLSPRSHIPEELPRERRRQRRTRHLYTSSSYRDRDRRSVFASVHRRSQPTPSNAGDIRPESITAIRQPRPPPSSMSASIDQNFTGFGPRAAASRRHSVLQPSLSQTLRHVAARLQDVAHAGRTALREQLDREREALSLLDLASDPNVSLPLQTRQNIRNLPNDLQQGTTNSNQSPDAAANKNSMNASSLSANSRYQGGSDVDGSLLSPQQRIRIRINQRREREESNSAHQSQEEPATQGLSNSLSSLALSQNAHPSSSTNGHPLLDGVDDMDLPHNPPRGVPRAMIFRPQQLPPNGWSSPESLPAVGPSSSTNGRPLLHSMDGIDGIRLPHSISCRPLRPMTFGPPQQPLLPEPLLDAGPSSSINGRRLRDFDDNAPRNPDTSSETEDVARQSRGPIIDVPLGSNSPIRDRVLQDTRLTTHVQSFLRVPLLTDDILCRGDGEVTRMGGGESYRPTARPRSPRTDSFRGDRDRDRSPRRERARTPPTDSWHPSNRDHSPRRRSRTPPRRDRSPLRDNWRARPRSPIRARTPPRRFSPRRDEDRRPRSPIRRDDRRRSRSPYDRDRPAPRTRSPLPRRSPPAGPRTSYRGRSRSLERRDDRVPTGPNSANWRRRSPSPPARDSERSSERTSGNTSRRSSPPIHSERLHLAQATTQNSRPRSPPTRDRSPPSQLAYKDRDSARSTPREHSPVRSVAARSPPRGPAGFRAPTGPSGGRNFTAPSPSLSSSNTPTSISAHNRSENSGPVIPPSGPRGYVPPARGAYSIRGGRGSFSSDRVSRPDTSTWGAAPPSRPAAELSRGSTPVSRPTQILSPSIPSGPAASIPTGPSGGIPTGPRAGIPSRPSLQHSSSSYNSRPNPGLSNNSGPRPHPAMANLPQIIPGGRIDPTASGIPSDIAARLKRKEEEAETLREGLHSKQEKLRQGLKGWDKLSRDSQSMGLRSELSERHVRMLAGEGVGGAAF